MNLRHRLVAACLVVAACLMAPGTAQAYVGPGVGLTAIGTILALVAALLLAIIGFVWYPVKRMMGKSKKRPAEAVGDQRETKADS